MRCSCDMRWMTRQLLAVRDVELMERACCPAQGDTSCSCFCIVHASCVCFPDTSWNAVVSSNASLSEREFLKVRCFRRLPGAVAWL